MKKTTFALSLLASLSLGNPALAQGLAASPIQALSAGTGIALSGNILSSTITQYTNGQASAAAPVQSVNGSTGTVALTIPAAATQIFSAKAVPINTTGDQGTITIPAAITKYSVASMAITNCSVTPLLAQIALWSGPGGTGTSVVAAATITGATSSSVVLNPAIAVTTTLTATPLYVRIAVANVASGTCDFYVVVNNLS